MIDLDISKPDRTANKQLDVSRLDKLGWRTRIPLADGLASTLILIDEQLRKELVRH